MLSKKDTYLIIAAFALMAIAFIVWKFMTANPEAPVRPAHEYDTPPGTPTRVEKYQPGDYNPIPSRRF